MAAQPPARTVCRIASDDGVPGRSERPDGAAGPERRVVRGAPAETRRMPREAHAGPGAPGRVPGTEERRRALRRIAARCAARPTLDGRPADELVGYDESGLPS